MRNSVNKIFDADLVTVGRIVRTYFPPDLWRHQASKPLSRRHGILRRHWNAILADDCICDIFLFADPADFSVFNGDSVGHFDGDKRCRREGNFSNVGDCSVCVPRIAGKCEAGLVIGIGNVALNFSFPCGR